MVNIAVQYVPLSFIHKLKIDSLFQRLELDKKSKKPIIPTHRKSIFMHLRNSLRSISRRSSMSSHSGTPINKVKPTKKSNGAESDPISAF